MTEPRPLAGARDEQARSFRRRLVMLVVAIVVLTGVGASLAWAKTRPAPIGNGVVVIETSLGEAGRAEGTGMVLTSSGEVLTNNHVIRGATTIRVVLPGTGRSYTAKALGYSVSKDVALLKANRASNLKTIALGNSSTVRVGHAVTATGNAGGSGTLTSSSGRVTALARAITVSDNDGAGQRLTGLIETSSELEPGDSGGPLFNSAHKVIGMNTAASVGYVFRGSRDADGYAIPINTAVAIAKQIEAGKSSTTVHVGATAFLGVSVAADDMSGSGAAIAGVVPGGAAAAAGLAPGDVITSIGGRTVSSSASLRSALLLQKPGARVSVTYVDMTGASGTVTVTLASGPPQ
jgi:S1-C subfamily serine protease